MSRSYEERFQLNHYTIASGSFQVTTLPVPLSLQMGSMCPSLIKKCYAASPRYAGFHKQLAIPRLLYLEPKILELHRGNSPHGHCSCQC
jgi:hypothetical protein